jgi:hypothetical protein
MDEGPQAMSNFKRMMPTDNSVQSLHVALGRLWDALESPGFAPSQAAVAKPQSIQTVTTIVPSTPGGGGGVGATLAWGNLIGLLSAQTDLYTILLTIPTNPMTAIGDMIVGGAAGIMTQVPIGTATYVWTSDGTTAAWAPPSGGAGSGITRSTVVISSNTSAGAFTLIDYVYICTATLTLTMPTAVANLNRYTIKAETGAIVTVATTGGQTIDGALTATLNPFSSIDLVSDGINWQVV